jgi:hypothetical protein
MQPQYEWHKGQDAWDEVVVSGRVQDPPVPGRWRGVLVVIVIIGLIGASVFWFLNRRTGTNTAAVEQDILATNSLIFQAIMAGDGELLRSNLSGRDPDWVAVHELALSRGLIYDRPFWGLQFQPSLPDESQIEVVLNPEWNTAELVMPLDYVYEAADGLTTTVQLEQTLLYRRSRERWLLAPADNNFWGERLLFEGRYLAIDYPARDGQIVERLAADLDGLVGEICRTIEGKGCTADFQLEFRLYTRSPHILAITPRINLLPCVEGDPELPTPTLVGLPVDEAGYEGLLHGYRSEIAAFTLAHMISAPNCDPSRLKIAMLDYRLSEMGFQKWPLTSEDYDKLRTEQFHLEQMLYSIQNDGDTIWNFENEAEVLRPSYALIEFVTEVYGTPLDEIEAYIDRGRLSRNFYWSTLHNWTDENFAADGPLEAAWERFLVEKAGVETAAAPELPEQNLRLVCYGGDITTGIAYPNGVLYELDLGTGELTAVYPLNHTDAYMTSLPGDEGVIVAEQRLDFVRENGRVLLWKDGGPVVLFETADNLVPVSFFDFRGRGGQFLAYDRGDQRYGGYLLAECVAGDGCNWSDFGGFPIISPSGEGFISLIPLGNHGYEGRFFRPFGVGRLMTLTDALVGKSPFWLSDERIGWVGEDGRTVLSLTVAGEDYPEEQEVLFTLTEVDPLLALDEAAAIESVVSRPEEPQDLLVTVRDGEGWVSIYQVNILRRWIQPLKKGAFSLDADTVYSFELSPERRWLVISGNELTTSTAVIHLLALDENGVHSFDYKMAFDRPMHWVMDWSAGDEWLALPDNGYIRLINPAADYQDVVVPEGVGCSGAVWVNK